MKDKKPLFMMIGILVFAIVMFVQPWKFLQKDEPADTDAAVAGEQTAGETDVQTGTEAAPAAPESQPPAVAEPAQTSTEPTPTIDPMEQPHEPANLYDIEGSDFMD